MKPFNVQRDELLAAINARAASVGTDCGMNASKASRKLLCWQHYFRKQDDSKIAAELLAGTRAAMLETATYLTLGLGRAALMAMRTEVDLFLSYTYFRDHPAEWTQLKETGNGFMLREAIYRYHECMSPRFKERLAILEQAFKLCLIDVYRILSAHIHGQSAMTAPAAGMMTDLVVSQPFAESIIELQRQCAETTSNFLFAVYAEQWPSLPEEILIEILDKLSPKQQTAFFGEKKKQ